MSEETPRRILSLNRKVEEPMISRPKPRRLIRASDLQSPKKPKKQSKKPQKKAEKEAVNAPIKSKKPVEYNKAIVTVGIPASGKSFWATEHRRENENWVEINRDNIRANIFNEGKPIEWSTYKFTAKKESLVSDTQEQLILSAYINSNNIIISDTNLNTPRREALVNRLEELGYTVEIKEFPISFEEAIKRDTARQNGVGYSTIAKMYEKWIQYKADEPIVLNDELTECYLFDIDGSLAHMVNRTPYEWDKVDQDEVIEPVVRVLRALRFSGYDIVLLSGRDESCRDLTIKWLNDNDIPFDDLLMRPNKSWERDTIVKKDMLQRYVLKSWNPLGVFDDRPSVCRMWREIGLPVFQLGNPYIEF